MRRRLLRDAGLVAVATALALGLISTELGAQAQPRPAARAAWTPPRMPDGHPDLQGVYDVATITPLERSAALGNRLTLTREEAEALEKVEAERDAEDRLPSDPNRAAPPVGGDRGPTKSYLDALFRAGGGVVGGYNKFWLAPGTDVVTVNGERRTSLIIDPVNGRIPAVLQSARARNTAYLATRVAPDASESAAAGPPGSYDNPEQRPLAERCLLGFGSTSGPPTLPNYFYNNLKQIVQTKDTIMILVEMVHDVRIIRMNQPHLPSTIRKWMGDSVGHWEGDTLVVDTTNFTDKTRFQGSGEDLHVVERFTRTDAKNVLYQFTVEDPTTWERPWKGEYPWMASDEKLYEYACHEGNYALAHVLSGARQTEKDAAAAK